MKLPFSNEVKKIEEEKLLAHKEGKGQREKERKKEKERRRKRYKE